MSTLINLLRLIRTSMYSGATSKKNPMHLLVEARQRFYSFRQTSRMSTAEFLRIYQGLVDNIVHLDGDFGTDEAVICKRILADNQDPNNTTTWDAMKTIVREYLTINLFLIADPKRYGGLLANTQNDYVSDVDKYPKTLSKSYDMLVNYVNAAKISNSNAQNLGMSFYQEDKQRGSGGRSNGCGGGRNGRGGRGDGGCGDGGRGDGGRGRHAQ